MRWWRNGENRRCRSSSIWHPLSPLSLPHVYANQGGVYQYHLHHREAGHSFAAPAQRPRQRCREQAGIAGWRAAGGRDLVWQWGTHRKCGFGHFWRSTCIPTGVDPQLDLSDLPKVAQIRGIHRYADFSASPYGGELVFAAFFPAPIIRMRLPKAFRWRKQHPNSCGMFPSAVGPGDIGRNYEA